MIQRNPHGNVWMMMMMKDLVKLECGLVVEYGIAQPKTKRCFQNDSIGIKKRKKAFWFEKNAAGGDLILTSTIS